MLPEVAITLAIGVGIFNVIFDPITAVERWSRLECHVSHRRRPRDRLVAVVACRYLLRLIALCRREQPDSPPGA